MKVVCAQFVITKLSLDLDLKKKEKIFNEANVRKCMPGGGAKHTYVHKFC